MQLSHLGLACVCALYIRSRRNCLTLRTQSSVEFAYLCIYHVLLHIALFVLLYTALVDVLCIPILFLFNNVY